MEVDKKESRQTFWATLCVCTPKKSPDPTHKMTFWVTAVIRNNVTQSRQTGCLVYSLWTVSSTISLQVRGFLSQNPEAKCCYSSMLLCATVTQQSTSLSLCWRMFKLSFLNVRVGWDHGKCCFHCLFCWWKSSWCASVRNVHGGGNILMLIDRWNAPILLIKLWITLGLNIVRWAEKTVQDGGGGG